MPPQHGETVLVTLFADVHYVFSPPGHRPPHVRFEKGSYVYVYHDASSGRGRIEIANNAGTSHQDAFDGSLEYAHFRHTQKQPCLFAVEILTHPHASQRQWQLKAFDQRHEREYMYPIQAMDIYLYTPEDAQELTGGLKRLHLLGGMDIEEPIQYTQRDSGAAMSPVVQNFENLAITSPMQTATPGQRSVSASTSSPQPQQASRQSLPQAQGGASYAPMGYNPAAPAAPEPIAHREKTPPPEDPEPGTGLPAAAMQDSGQWASHVSYARQGGLHYPQGQTHYTATTASPYQHASPASPPQQSTSPALGVAPAGAVGVHPGSQPSAPKSRALPFQQYSQSLPTPNQPNQHPQAVFVNGAQPLQYSSPLQSPSNNGSFPQQPQSPGFAPPPTSNLPAQHTPPPGGYSMYSYAPAPQQHSSDAHEVHKQLYRPTEAEATKNMPAGEAVAAGSGQAPGRFESKATSIEKGVNKWLKRLDKHF